MSALIVVQLSSDGAALGTTPGANVATSAPLTAGQTYWVVGSGRAGSAVANTNSDATLSIGGVVFRRILQESFGVAPSGLLATPANGSSHQLSYSFVHTPSSADTMTFEAWLASGAGEASIEGVAIDITPLTEDTDYWNTGFTNSDTVDVQPAASAGWTTVETLAVTAAAARDFIVAASCELVRVGGAAADEMRARVVVNGSVLDPSLVEHDAGDRASGVAGYLFLDRVALASGSNTIELQVEGVDGTIGARRQSIFVLDTASLDEAPESGSESGETVTGATTADPTGLTVTYGDGTIPWLLHAHHQKQVAFWAESRFRIGGSNVPSDGFGVAVSANLGTGAGDDMMRELGFSLRSAPSTETAQLQIGKFGSGTNNYGSDAARAAGPMRIIAIPLSATSQDSGATVSADGTPSATASASDGDAQPGGVNSAADGSPSAQGAVFDGTLSLGLISRQADQTAAATASAFDGTLTSGGSTINADTTATATAAAFDGALVSEGQTLQADGTPSATATVSSPHIHGLNDDFEGGPVAMGDRGWNVYKPAAFPTNEVVDGRARIRIGDGGVGPTASNWYQGNDGGFNSKTISGDIAIRGRFYVWGDDLVSLPRLQPARFSITGVAAHDPDRTTMNYVHGGAGSFNNNYVFETKTTDDSASTFPTVVIVPGGGGSPTTPWIIDIMLEREGDEFRTFYRNAPSVQLASNDGWVAHQTYTRSDLPTSLDWGFMAYDATSGDDDIGTEVEEIQFTAVGAATATADQTASGSASAFDGSMDPGPVAATQDVTAAAVASVSDPVITPGGVTVQADGTPSAVASVGDASIPSAQQIEADTTAAASASAFDGSISTGVSALTGYLTVTILPQPKYTVEHL